MDIETKFTSREINLLLWKTGETVSTAESCTGGNVAAALTSIPGSSNYFKGGIVTYSDETKMRYLGVKAETIEAHSVYSEEVVKEMVAGALKAFDSTYAIAISGVAGPTGGTPENPVGTVWIAVGNAEEVVTKKRTENEGRERNIQYAVCDAVEMLLEFVKAHQPVAEDAEEVK